MTPTVFADANILIAGSASRRGASRAVLNLAESGMIKLVVTRQVLDEAERNMRKKLPRALPFFAELLSYIDLLVLDNPKYEQYERWLPMIEASDAPILEAAVCASVDYFITLNTKDFTPSVAKVSGLNIQMPGEFIEQIRFVIQQGI